MNPEINPEWEHCDLFEHIQEPEIELVKYQTPEALLFYYWNLEEQGLTWGEFLESEMEGETGDGEIIKMSPSDQLNTIISQGFWGFADEDGKRIDVWVDEKTPIDKVIFFFAHEIGHTIGEKIEGEDMESEVREEERAHSYGIAARLAYKWAVEKDEASEIKQVAGALKSCIDAHGPIDAQWIGSAAKRIVKQLKGSE